mmetsp:Transcript_3716/g.8349  ORF Transcript_3716/g.8349 Transcript_3716/m.8349 type:complete len:81 (-) Transcript_3716:87-329(-)
MERSEPRVASLPKEVFEDRIDYQRIRIASATCRCSRTRWAILCAASRLGELQSAEWPGRAAERSRSQQGEDEDERRRKAP